MLYHAASIVVPNLGIAIFAALNVQPDGDTLSKSVVEALGAAVGSIYGLANASSTTRYNGNFTLQSIPTE